jgi:hypothetical protein
MWFDNAIAINRKMPIAVHLSHLEKAGSDAIQILIPANKIQISPLLVECGEEEDQPRRKEQGQSGQQGTKKSNKSRPL